MSIVGTLQDMVGRLRAVLPPTWFPNTGLVNAPQSSSPVLDGLLSGVAWVWSQTYSLLQYVLNQTRIATASGVFLDIIAHDFFGPLIQRRGGELDTAFRARIKKELFREKGTRAGLITALTDLTGRVPHVFEPAYPLDTGAYNSGQSLAYNMAGGYGSLLLPFQFFVTAFLPNSGGVAGVAGWGDTNTFIAVPITDYNGNPIAGLTYNIPGGTGMPGGYGVGAIEYATLDMVSSHVTEADIYNTINDVRPAATIAWTSIRS